MEGRLNDILPEPISEESEKIILELIKRKMAGGVRLAIHLLQAMEERFGIEARRVMKEMIDGRKPGPNPTGTGDPEQDLHDFCDNLERGCVGSHRWRREVDEPDRIGYSFTRCMWAEIFRELGEPELGFYYCAGDEPSVKSHNPKLGLRRTKVLMLGDEICDHVFLLEK
jgi:hypothetical protein